MNIIYTSNPYNIRYDIISYNKALLGARKKRKLFNGFYFYFSSPIQ